MLLLISPAKSLNFEPTSTATHSQPSLLAQSKILVEAMKKLNQDDIQKLMKVSEKIATLNVERNQSFQFPFNLDNAKQAILAFDGDVYTGMNASDFSTEELNFAQQHIGILSGLYGFLRPLDLIQAYRLEMGTKFAVKESKNLYQFWGERIANEINKTQEKYIINLASNEYFKSVDKKVLQGDLYTVNFKENRNGVYKTISFSAKRARGMMCRYVVKNQLSEPQQMKAFDLDGYQYNEELSSEKSYIFSR